MRLSTYGGISFHIDGITQVLIVAASYYSRYIDKVKDDPLLDALKVRGRQFVSFLGSVPAERWDFAYAEGKWTVKQVVQHVCDTERVMAYRALWFARGATSELPSMDQEQFAAGVAQAGERAPKSLINEFKALRRSTRYLFKNFSDADLARVGVASGKEVSVLALGYIIAGHAVHHMEVIMERYLEVV